MTHAKSSSDCPAVPRSGATVSVTRWPPRDDNHWHLPADRRVLHETGELSHAADALAVELDDLVAGLDAGLLRRARRCSPRRRARPSWLVPSRSSSTSRTLTPICPVRPITCSSPAVVAVVFPPLRLFALAMDVGVHAAPAAAATRSAPASAPVFQSCHRLSSVLYLGGQTHPFRKRLCGAASCESQSEVTRVIPNGREIDRVIAEFPVGFRRHVF